MSETNSALPTEWTTSVLEEVINIHDSERQPINRKERQERLSRPGERYPYFGATGQAGEIDDFRSEGESILLGEDAAPFLDPLKDKAYLVDGRYWVNNHAHILRAKGGQSNAFYAYQLNRISYVGYVSGTTRLKLTQREMKRLPLVVAPFPEQARIVSRIDELFSDIEAGERAVERARAALSRYRKAVLKAAVTGELTTDWRADNPSSEPAQALLTRIRQARYDAWKKAELEKLDAKGKARPKTKKQWETFRGRYKAPPKAQEVDIVDLPNTWAFASLPELGEFGRGKSKHRPRNDPKLYGGDYPFLQTGMVRGSGGKISRWDKTYNEVGLAQSKLWPAGTVCITIAANIADTGILQMDACFPDSVVGLVPHPDIGPEYPEFFMRTMQSDLSHFAPATAQKNINLAILETVSVPLPPIAEQREIVSRVEEALSRADAVEASLDAQTRQAQALRQAILKRAFAGELVDQDPNDEPASELLERIKAL